MKKESVLETRKEVTKILMKTYKYIQNSIQFSIQFENLNLNEGHDTIIKWTKVYTRNTNPFFYLII